jgi:hypothetical protein
MDNTYDRWLYPASSAFYNEFVDAEPNVSLPGGQDLYVPKYELDLYVPKYEDFFLPGTWVLANRPL